MIESLAYQVDFALDAPKVTLTFGDARVSHVFVDANGGNYCVSDGVYLQSVYDGVDFIYKPYFAEIKEEIVIHDRDSLLNLETILECQNCTICREGDSYYVVANSDKIWRFMPLYAQDALGRETDEVEIKIYPVGENKYTISILISPEWLKQAEFPIVIDPTMALAADISASSVAGASELYSKVSIPVDKAVPIINDGAETTNKTQVYIKHENLPDDVEDFSIRNWRAQGDTSWSKWYPVSDVVTWELPSGQEGLNTVEVKYRLSTTPAHTPQEDEVGDYITTSEGYYWLERYRNTIGGEVLSVVAYGNDLYIGSKIPYGDDFKGALWKFNGKYFTFISDFDVVIDGDRINVFPYVMKTIGSSIYIGAGRDDYMEGAGVVFRYNDSNGVILASLLGGNESKVTAITAYMSDIYVGTKENRVYRYNIETQWSLAFDLSFDAIYDGIEDLTTLNGIYCCVYDGSDTAIYYYDGNALNLAYTLYDEHVLAMQTVPGDYSDTGAYEIYLYATDKIFRFTEYRDNDNNAVYEQMESAPNSPWLRSYITLQDKPSDSYNMINSAAIPLPTEAFVPTVVGKNGYIATFNDMKTLQISAGVTDEDLNDIAFVMPSDGYLTDCVEIQFNSNDYFYGYRLGDQIIYKADNSFGDIVASMWVSDNRGYGVPFAIGKDDDIIYYDNSDGTLNIFDKSLRHKKTINLGITVGPFMQYNPYDGYLYINRIHSVNVYDLEQERVVRTIGNDDDSSGIGNGEFKITSQKAFDENHIYIVDTNNDRIQKFDLSGAYISQWGTSGSGDGQFDAPTGIVIIDDYIYVSDTNNSRIQKFDKDGNFISILAITQGTGEGEIYYPYGLAADSEGYLYVVEWKATDAQVGRIQKFQVDGTFVAEFLRDGASPSSPKSENRSYIVGNNGTYLVSIDGGYNYTAVVPAGDPFGTQNLTSIAINKNDPNYMLITDDDGYIYTTTDGGTTWSSYMTGGAVMGLYDCTFSPWSSDFSGALACGYRYSVGHPVPIIVALSADGSLYNTEFWSGDSSDYYHRAISITYDNRGWIDNTHTNDRVFAVVAPMSRDSAYGSTAGEPRKLIVYNEDDGWEYVSVNGLGVWGTDVFAYDNKVAAVGLNFAVFSDDNGDNWHAEEMGVQNSWQRVFYYGDDKQGYVIGNFYQGDNVQNSWQKAPVRRFEPDYNNWPVYVSASDSNRKYYDVVAQGSISNITEPDGSNYGYITYSSLNGIYDDSYREFPSGIYVVIERYYKSISTALGLAENWAYRVVDIDLANKRIYFDEIGEDFYGISGDYNNNYGDKTFYIVAEDNKNNSLIITSPIGNTVLFSHDTEETKWYDNVDNDNGWVVEFAMCLLDGLSPYSTDSSAYQGVDIADGSKCMSLRVYRDKVALVVGDNVYTFDANILSSPDNVGFLNVFSNGVTNDRLHIYTVRGCGNDVEVYIDHIKIDELSGAFLLATTDDKYLRFGDLVGADFNSAAKWSYIYYKTDEPISYSATLLNTFGNSSEVKKAFHVPYNGYSNFQENVFVEDFTKVLWAHNTTNTPWVDRVSNSGGWIVEFDVTNTNADVSFYDRARIYDGTRGLELRFYHGANPYVLITIGNNSYAFTSVGSKYYTVFGALSDDDTGNKHTFRLEGQNEQLKCYIDNILIDELSGDILTSSTSQKFIDFGNNSGVGTQSEVTNWGVIKYYISGYSTSVFDVYGNSQYDIYWTYIKETEASVSVDSVAIHNTDLEGWYVVTQTDEPKVGLYINKLGRNELSTLFDKNIFCPEQLHYLEDITTEMGQVNDAIGFYYINGDTDSYKMLFVGRDVDNDDALVKMVRYGHCFADIIVDYDYGYPLYKGDVYISPATIDKGNLVSKIYIVAQGKSQLNSKIYVYNDSVAVFFYKDYDLTVPLDEYDGVPVADFNTNDKKVYIKIVYYSPKDTPPTVAIDQQGSVDAILTADRVDAYSFRVEYPLHEQEPNDYLDGFATVTIYD